MVGVLSDQAPQSVVESSRDRARILIAHPSPDVYGSDLQLVETVRAVTDRGASVRVVLPSDGPLVPLLEKAGADVRVLPFPVLRKAMLSPRGMVLLAAALPGFLLRAHRTWRRFQPDALLVNTLTIPWWLLVGVLRRTPGVCHVHEAEADQPRWIRLALAMPLLWARTVVTNSRSARDTVVRSFGRLRRRTVVVYNGVPGPDVVVPPRSRHKDDPLELVLVGRLSPRKGTDVALEAVALLRAEGRQVRLRLCGSVFEGYEWFEQDLRDRASRADLAGAVEFLGYVDDPSVEVARADIVLVPSRTEPFGNVAVEGMLAERPVIASRVQGLAEIVRDGETGVLVEPGDPGALADAVRRVSDVPAIGARMARAGREDASRRFSVDRFSREIVDVLLPHADEGESLEDVAPTPTAGRTPVSPVRFRE